MWVSLIELIRNEGRNREALSRCGLRRFVELRRLYRLLSGLTVETRLGYRTVELGLGIRVELDARQT
jgi:hypothetical protein